MASVVSAASGGHHHPLDGVERDIDGVPLRHQKKINLKDILGHNPVDDEDEDVGNRGPASAHQHQVSDDPSRSMSLGFDGDDDEYEYGYEDDDDDCPPKRRPLQRRSSLRVVHSLPTSSGGGADRAGSPTSPHKKAVRFADAIGLFLADVRDLINSDEPPEVPHSALKDLKIRKKRSKTEGRYRLFLAFTQPGGDAWFLKRVLDDKVALENCVVCDRELTVSGIIRVANIAFQKQVHVRYTVDDWKQSQTSRLSTTHPRPIPVTDRFLFLIHLPDGFGPAAPGQGKGSELVFAISFQADTVTYWDNNRGANYIVVCVTCTPNHSPCSPDDSPPIRSRRRSPPQNPLCEDTFRGFVYLVADEFYRISC